MKNLNDKKVNYNVKTIFVPIGVYLLLILGFIIGIIRFERMNKEQNLLLTEQAIRKAIIQCYSNEGIYPSELSYLEDNYYLTIDYDSYYIVYDSVASNLHPNFAVFDRE